RTRAPARGGAAAAAPPWPGGRVPPGGAGGPGGGLGGPPGPPAPAPEPPLAGAPPAGPAAAVPVPRASPSPVAAGGGDVPGSGRGVRREGATPAPYDFAAVRVPHPAGIPGKPGHPAPHGLRAQVSPAGASCPRTCPVSLRAVRAAWAARSAAASASAPGRGILISARTRSWPASPAPPASPTGTVPISSAGAGSAVPARNPA